MSKDHPGLFVTVDGMAGAGKTTTIRLLGRRLRTLGYRVHTTAEPTHGTLGELARQHTATYRKEVLACLVAADRYHHLDTEIHPHLRQREIVICDRYVASSYVLQQLDGVNRSFIMALNSRTRRPDLAILLITEPAVATARIAKRGAHDRFQTGLNASTAEATMYEIATSYLTQLGTPAVVTIDTTVRRPQQIAEDIASRIAEQITASTQPPSQ